MDPNNQQNKTTSNKFTHTLSEDMAVAIQDNKDGFVKKIIHEQEEKEEEKKILAVYSRRNKIYIALAILFILTASSFVAYIFFRDNISSFFVKNRFAPLIFHESSQVLDITGKNRESIVTTIQGLMINEEREPSVVEGIYFLENKKTVGFNRFLSLIESNFNGTIDLFNENFLVGIIKHLPTPEPSITEEDIIVETNEDGTKKILEDFIILPTTSLFKTGSTDFIDNDAKNKAKELIGYFLDTVSFKNSKVQIIGTFATERPLSQNQEIAEARKKVGIALLDEVLKEKYTEEQIKELLIESSAKGISINEIYTEEELSKMSEEEKNEKIALNQGITFLSKAKPQIIEENRDVIDNTSPKEINSIFPEDTSLFILLKVNSFADVFNQMKTWEDKMFTDLHGFFGIEIFADTSYLLTKDFVDGIIQNKNARILYDDNGQIILMYVYVDESSVVVTNSENTVREVILRVNSSKIKR